MSGSMCLASEWVSVGLGEENFRVGSIDELWTGNPPTRSVSLEVELAGGPRS